MDLTTTTIPNNTTTTVKTTEPDTETPTRVKLTPFTNGVLKRHAPPLHHPIVVRYKECLRNHAAALGTHAVDGCGEFMPSLATCNQAPADIKCAACGCHRNFHRREPENLPPQPLTIEYQPHHRHHPPPPPSDSPNNSPSPPPISSAYYPSSAPHMLLALSHSMSAPPAEGAVGPTAVTAFVPGFGSAGRKRFRTRFTQEQKEKMSELAERVGWKMLKRDEDVITEFCNGIGVEKSVFKVWMHNNKHHFGKHKDGISPSPSPSPVGINTTATTTPTTVIGAITGNGYLEEIKPNFQHVQEMNHQNLMGNGNGNGTQIRFQGLGANGNGTGTQSSSC